MRAFLSCLVFILICGVFLSGCAQSATSPQSTGSQNQASQSANPAPTESIEPKPTPTPTPPPKRQQDLNIAVSVYNAEAPQDTLFIKGVEKIFDIKENSYEILDAKGDSDMQKKQIEEAASGDFDVLIIKTSNPTAISAAAKDAQSKMPVIAVPQIESFDADYSIDIKESEIAHEAAKVLVDNIKEGKKVVIINVGEQSATTEEKAQAFIDAAKQKDLNIVGNKDAENKEQAVSIISNWMLAYPNIEGIWATSPEALQAAVDVVGIMQRDDVIIGGIGEDLDLIKALGNESITVLGAGQPVIQGELAARAALMIGTEISYPKTAEAPYGIYTPEQYGDAATALWDTELVIDNTETDESNQ